MEIRNYIFDAQVALYAMNVRYQYFGDHPWIKETIIPDNDFQRKIYKEERENFIWRFRKGGRR